MSRPQQYQLGEDQGDDYMIETLTINSKIA